MAFWICRRVSRHWRENSPDTYFDISDNQQRFAGFKEYFYDFYIDLTNKILYLIYPTYGAPCFYYVDIFRQFFFSFLECCQNPQKNYQQIHTFHHKLKIERKRVAFSCVVKLTQAKTD